MKQFFKTSAILLTVALILSSCATIITGTKAEITINGQQEEPVNITTVDNETYEQVMLPYVLKISRNDLNEKISVTSEHYIYRDFIPGRKINGWILGNIVLGGVIGLGVDAATGALYDTKRDSIQLQYKSKTEQQ